MPNKFTHSIIILTLCIVIIFSVILSINISLKFMDKKISPFSFIPNTLNVNPLKNFSM